MVALTYAIWAHAHGAVTNGPAWFGYWTAGGYEALAEIVLMVSTVIYQVARQYDGRR